jgi:hypothetical protein
LEEVDNIVSGAYEWKKTLGKNKHRWKENIKLYI